MRGLVMHYVHLQRNERNATQTPANLETAWNLTAPMLGSA